MHSVISSFSLVVAAVAMLVLGGCDNPPDAHKPHSTDHQADADNAAHAIGELTAHDEELTRTAAGCEGDGCTQVTLRWQQFEGHAALNAAIRERLVKQLAVDREGGSPAPTTLEGAAKAFLALADTLPDGVSDGWQLTGEAKRLARHGPLLTVEISSYEFTGGAHGMPVTRWLNWDLARQQAVPLSALIQPGQEAAFWKAAQQAHQQWLADDAKADADFRQAWPFQKTGDYRLTDDGVVLLYQVYSIAPYAMGQPQLTLPWDQVKAAVRPAWRP